MMPDDLVTRLSRTLENVEHIAENAHKAAEMRRDWVAGPTPWEVEVRTSEDAHIVRWDPQAVLRLVAAHREVAAAYEAAQERAASLLRDRAHGATVLEADGVAAGLRTALKHLAEGWGLS